MSRLSAIAILSLSILLVSSTANAWFISPSAAGAHIKQAPAAPRAQAVYDEEFARQEVMRVWNELLALRRAVTTFPNNQSIDLVELRALCTRYLALPVSYNINWALVPFVEGRYQHIADQTRDILNHLKSLAGDNSDALPRLFNADAEEARPGRVIPGGDPSVYNETLAREEVLRVWNELLALHIAATQHFPINGNAEIDLVELRAVCTRYLALPVTFQINWSLLPQAEGRWRRLADETRNSLNRVKALVGDNSPPLPRLFNGDGDADDQPQIPGDGYPVPRRPGEDGDGTYNETVAREAVMHVWNELLALHLAATEHFPANVEIDLIELKALVTRYLALPVKYQINWSLMPEVTYERAQQIADETRDGLNRALALAGDNRKPLPRLFNADAGN